MDEESSDSVEMSVKRRNERAERLGFRPQQELFCNKFLPYDIDNESLEILDNIKRNLGKCVAMREMSPGISIYVSRLMKYIKLYGMKISKEDHIMFVKLLLELIAIPNLEPDKVNKFSYAITQLLRKPEWISPDDLEIDWRPLYDLCNLILNKNCSKGDLYRYFPNKNETSTNKKSALDFKNFKNLAKMAEERFGIKIPASLSLDSHVEDEIPSLETNLQCLIQYCAPYFAKSSTKDILDELLPKLQPLDIGKSCQVFEFFHYFVNGERDVDLWFDKFMDIWNTYHNPAWGFDMMIVFAAAGYKNIGYIDWEPHIPTIFARILRAIDFPVSYKSMKSARSQQLTTHAIGLWIVSVLGPKSSGQKYLNTFMSTIESYLHPANSGKWVTILGDILTQLPKYFFDRLVLERYKKHPWRRPVPDDYKLTEDCITAFVECFKPVAFQAMYSRINPQDVGQIFKHLADLRPEMIIPTIIERVYSSLDSLTEPHKMTASLQSLISVSRALVSGHNGYTEGRTHVIPIFFATLPGIDSNDFKKTSITFHFLTSISILIPIVDCSKAGLHYNNLTDDENLLCEQTADFENFVLQYMDRIFILIEASSMDHVRMEQSHQDNLRSKLENISEALIQACTHAILGQCSEEILRSASRKMIDFVKTHLLEPKVAGQLAGSMVRVFARINGKDILKSLVPYVIQMIERLIEDHDDIMTIEKQSEEMLYYQLLLKNLLRGDPNIVPSYIDSVLPVLDQILKFKCKLSNTTGTAILINIMSNLSGLQTLDIKNSRDSFIKPLSEYLPIKSWGEKMSPDAKIDWCFPDENCRKICEKVLHRYLIPILDEFEKYCNDEIELSRDEINHKVSIITSLIRCTNFLPNWDDEDTIELFDTCIDRNDLKWRITLGFDNLVINMPNGENVRRVIIDAISNLQAKILAKNEDDTKSLKSILMLYDKVVVRRHSNSSFDSQVKNYNNTKKFQTYRLTRYKRDVRAVIATRVIMQQDCRDEIAVPLFTKTHKKVVDNLMTLAISHYSSIRSNAQSKLMNLLQMFSYSYKMIVDRVVDLLQLDSNTNHEQFKGALYILVSNRRSRMIIKHDWEVMFKIWTNLLLSKLSDKPSVLRLLDDIADIINHEFPTITTEIHIGDKCVDYALKLLHGSEVMVDIDEGKRVREALNRKNVQLYNDMVNKILSIVENDKLHWRYHLLATTMLFNLVHPLTRLPQGAVTYAVNNLINDSLEERKISVFLVNNLLKQMKREHPKIKINPFDIIGVEKQDLGCNFLPGYRPDNLWLQYELENVPKNQEDWDQPRYMYKCNGYFGWSKDFCVYAPSSEQPNLDKPVEEMDEFEKTVYLFFTNQENVDKLIKFWSLEEKKGKDKFNRARFFLIKCLLSMFGDRILPYFIRHLKRLIEDKASESSHRCAAEIMAGIMRGTKHWPYGKVEKMYQEMVPLIRLALNNVTVDTDFYWGTCFATSAEHMDPSKQYWLHEVLLEEPLQESTSFIDCNRLYCLQGAFNQHVWRMASVSKRLLEYLRPYLDHSFQNVRDRIGSTLINIFEGDLEFAGGNPTISPQIKNMIAEVLPKFEILLKKDVPKMVAQGKGEPMETDQKSEQDKEFEMSVRLFKTIAIWITGIINRCSNGNEIEFFEILPIACRLERSEQDSELAEICSSILAMISQALTLPKCMPAALEKINDISKMTSWSARRSVIDVLQVLVFYNMTIILSNDEWKAKVQEIVLRLLEDNVLEVREKAAEVLGGLLHTSFLTSTDELLKLFIKKCRTKMIKGPQKRLHPATICSSEASEEANAVRARHTGVLGLCAFISAYPYEVPEFVPSVFEHLGAHLNDPQPIPATIRKTMGDFKRTHHDNWEIHQLKFNEEQLAVLSDLTIPPSYYA